MAKKSLFLSSDWLGMASASLCMIHCLLTPFLVLGASQIAWWHDITGLFLVLSAVAVWLSTRQGTHTGIKTLIWVSFALLALCVIGEAYWEPFHEISYLASLGLVIGHLWNHARSGHRHTFRV